MGIGSSLMLGLLLFIVGIIATVVVPGAGLFIGLILVVLAVLIVIGGFAAGRRRTPAPPPS
jgi:hypothetical protein